MMFHQEDSLVNVAYLLMFAGLVSGATQAFELLKRYRQLQGSRKELQVEVDLLRARVEEEAAARQEVEKREVQLLEKVEQLTKTTEEVGAELICAKDKSSALLLQQTMLQAEQKRHRDLCREHSAALVRSGEELVGEKSLVEITVARMGELEGRLVVLAEEKVGAEVQAQVAEVKFEDALAGKRRVEEQMEAKFREFAGLAYWPVQMQEQVRAYEQQLREASERENALLAKIDRARW